MAGVLYRSSAIRHWRYLALRFDDDRGNQLRDLHPGAGAGA
jgi:hypothetical protein